MINLYSPVISEHLCPHKESTRRLNVAAAADAVLEYKLQPQVLLIWIVVLFSSQCLSWKAQESRKGVRDNEVRITHTNAHWRVIYFKILHPVCCAHSSYSLNYQLKCALVVRWLSLVKRQVNVWNEQLACKWYNFPIDRERAQRQVHLREIIFLANLPLSHWPEPSTLSLIDASNHSRFLFCVIDSRHLIM